MPTATQHNADLVSNEESSDNGSHLTSAGVGTTMVQHDARHFNVGGDTFTYIGVQNVGFHSIKSFTLDRLTSFAALHDSSAQDPDRTCFPGTRKHVLEIIQRWIDNPSAERIVWLHGPAGIGKSAIAQTVAHANQRDKVATFFFYRSDPSLNDGNRLFPTLAWQLAISTPAIKHHISQSLHIRPDLPTGDVETQFEELIIQPSILALNERTSSIRQQAPVIIIDGIDECLDESLQQRILKVIGTAVRNIDFPLRFLISSRSEAHIEETINRFESPILDIDLARFIDANSDVEHYLRAEFARIAADQCIHPTWPSHHIVQRLVFKSAGHFLYATDLIRFIGDPHNNALTQLDIILGLKPPRTMSPLAQVGELYSGILNRVPDKDFLKTFLGLLVGRSSISGDRLSDDDSMLMDISRVELGRKLRQMRSILKFEPYIDPYYPSFLEFLQDPSCSGQYHVSKSAGTRKYLELMTDLLIRRAARLTNQPNFHGNEHFAPEFGKLINGNPKAIELDIEDWEQIICPLLNVLDKLLVPSNIDTFKMDGYCQQCRFFQITYDTLMHLKSLREREDPDVEKYLKSLEEIIRYGDARERNFDRNFGRGIFGLAAIVGSLMAVLAHQR